MRWFASQVQRVTAPRRCLGVVFAVLLPMQVSVVTQAAQDRTPRRLLNESYLGERILTWKIGASTFRALPERGARLMDWRVEENDGTTRSVLHWPELNTLDGFYRVHGGNPILFPFAGPSMHAGERRRWRDAEGYIRPMPMHGIARQGRFEVTAADDRGFTALFKPDSEAEACYPFQYRFTVTYAFEERRLVGELRLQNLDDRPLPWSAGFHPYLAVPWRSGTQRSDYEIRLPHCRVVGFEPPGRLVNLPALDFPQPLTNPDIRGRYFLGLAENELSVGRSGTTDQVLLRIGETSPPDPDTAVLLWTQSADSPFFCVEPWMGPRNAAETSIGLRRVFPGEEQRFRIEITLP